MPPSTLPRPLAALLTGMLLSLYPAFAAESTDLLSQSLALVQQVESPTGSALPAAQRIDLLTQAIKLAQEAPNHRLQGHRVAAIQDMRTAVLEIRQGDPNQKAAGDLRDAENELSGSVALAETAPSPLPPAAAGEVAAGPSPASQTPPSPHVVETGIPQEVTPEMEQAFLTKYKAALGKQDADALFSFVAMDPNIDAKAKESYKGTVMLGAALDLSNPDRTYSFVPVLPGAKDERIQINGKMYGAYLPAVVGLKITFGKPSHPSSEPMATGDTTMPLCVQDHHLMMMGLKEIPGAVPPPAVDKAANFGIEPNLRKVSDKAAWDDGDAFTSLNEFLASLKQPAVQVLDSGESTYEYYAICRIAPNLCVWAGGDKAGEKNYTFYFSATDSNKQQLNGAKKWIRLVDVPTDNGAAPNVQGTVFFVPDPYSGPITLVANYGDESGKTEIISRTVDWK